MKHKGETWVLCYAEVGNSNSIAEVCHVSPSSSLSVGARNRYSAAGPQPGTGHGAGTVVGRHGLDQTQRLGQCHPTVDQPARTIVQYRAAAAARVLSRVFRQTRPQPHRFRSEPMLRAAVALGAFVLVGKALGPGSGRNQPGR